jgi:hypothetical protein
MVCKREWSGSHSKSGRWSVTDHELYHITRTKSIKAVIKLFMHGPKL